MPNWCSTQIRIRCNDKEGLKSLYDSIENKWTKKDYKKNSFGRYWLGNIVGNAHIGTVNENSKTDLRCRGSIEYMELSSRTLYIETITAFQPMLRLWCLLLDKYLPDATITYSSEEIGSGDYLTNDPELIGKYIIDSFGEDDVTCCDEADEEHVVCMIQKLLHTDESSIDMLLQMLSLSEFDDHVRVYKWQEYSPDEFE